MISFQRVQSHEQVQEVARLAREIWLEHYAPIIGQKQVDYMLEKFQSESAIVEQIGKSYEYFIIKQDAQNAGYLAVVPHNDANSLLLSKLYVRKSARGHGLGKKALEFVENICRERGIKSIWLTVNKHNSHSIEWYCRMGFRNAGPTVQDIGEGFVMDDFRMEKRVVEV
jgi:ribosomal protein S18 acetylase RimI-like enzyme